MDLAIGTLALILSRFVKAPALRLFLVLVAAFSYFWEGGYAVQAMIHRDGDLYFTGASFIGEPSLWWRITGGMAGLALFLAAIRLTQTALLKTWTRREVRRTASVAWLAAAAATTVAALFYGGHFSNNLHDAIMEIGIASLPLLLIPLRAGKTVETSSDTVTRSPVLIALGVIVFAAFILTLGHGFG